MAGSGSSTSGTLSADASSSGRRRSRPPSPASSGDAASERKPDAGDEPNPCSSEAADKDPCDCPTPPRARSQPERSKRPKPRPDDPCEQLIEMLRGIPGLEGRDPHKPKQRPERKVQALCDALGVVDSVLPLLAVLWERHEEREPGRNNFEVQVDKIFGNLDEKDAKTFGYAFGQYQKLRKSGKGECLFNDCLAEAARRGPVQQSWVAEELLREGLKLAGQAVFRESNGDMGPGQVRLWDNTVFHGPNGSGATVYQGPWPWLTAIRPATSSYEEYGNVQSFRPVPGSSHVWQPYQYDQECQFSPDPSGKLVGTCTRKHPPPASPGSLGPNSCEGGPAYTKGNDCLQIPAQRPGGSVTLRGFNFVTPSVKVRLSSVDDPSVFHEGDEIVWGDIVTPLEDENGHVITDERVSDCVSFQVPSAHPTIPGAPLPTGLYEVVVKVQNVTNAIYDGGTPPVLISNKLLLRIEADPNVKYLLWSDHGRCNRETPGAGDDEIWWDAFVGHIVPTEVPVPATGSSAIEIKDVERRSFPRAPWEDMDDGESAGSYSIDIFGPKAFELYGVAVVGIVGFEVDSESAARDQLQGFWNAWGQALSSIAGVALGAGGTVSGLANLAVKAGVVAAKVAFSVALIALAVVAAILLVATVFWAAWAPADLIALDIMHFEAATAWAKTDPRRPLPAETTRAYGNPYDEEVAVSVTERALPKDHTPGDAAATWSQEIRYDTPEDGEDSSYTLLFRLARRA